MKNAITYSTSMRAFLPRAILVAVLLAIAPFYVDHTERLITVSLTILGFLLLSWLGSKFLIVKINEESLQGFLLPLPRTRILAWEDIESIKAGNWCGLKCYVITAKSLSTGCVGFPFHLNDKQDFRNRVESHSGKDGPLSHALRNEL